MRLISQKGWGYIDIEYENGTITMDYTSEGTRIIYSWNDDSGECVIMAEYSSREKAIKALEEQASEKRKSEKSMRIEAKKLIEEHPTAYDVDKVVTELYDKSFERYGNSGMGGELVVNFDDAVEIVKRGGVDER